MGTKIHSELFGKQLLNKYHPKYMDLSKWLNHFEYLIDVIKIEEDDKVTFLLDMVEPYVVTKIQEKVSPFDPYNLTYDRLISVLDKLFVSPYGINIADYRYILRSQFPYESIQNYILTLRNLLCKCSPTIHNGTCLKDRFIVGLNDEEITKVLGKSENVSFNMAIAVAKQSELAMKRVGKFILK